MIEFRIANKEDDFLHATELITKVYTREGYITPSKEESDISSFIGQGPTTTILAHMGNTLLGTISIVPDSLRGLPMDRIFKDELSPLREEHKKIAEVCQFAIDASIKRAQPSELEVSIGLLGLIVHYGIHHAFDYLTFVINPKHRLFYESLGCVQIGGEKQYPSVNEAPALGYILDAGKLGKLRHAKGRTHFLIAKILSTPPSQNFFDTADQDK